MANLQKIWVYSLCATIGLCTYGTAQDLGGDDWGNWFEAVDTTATQPDTSKAADTWGDWSTGDAVSTEATAPAQKTDEFSDWGIDLGSNTEPEKPTTELSVSQPFDPNAPYGMGMAIELSAVSPFWVTRKMKTWYSFMDWRLGVRLPLNYELPIYGIRLTANAELASFKFENTFPQGGTFNGISALIYARALYQQFGLDAGLGIYGKSFGLLLGGNYTYSVTPTFYIGVGGRGVWVSQVDPLGSAGWADIQILVGYKF